MPVPLSGCSSGLAVATALLALALLPVQYYVPELYSSSEETPEAADRSLKVPQKQSWFDASFSSFPPLDLIFAALLMMLAFAIYVCEWIQRKLMERRIIKLNHYLRTSLERLRAWDARQEQLEGALRAVQSATAEYNLLLYLLLRQQSCQTRVGPPAPHNAPPNCLDKEPDDDFAFLRNPALERHML